MDLTFREIKSNSDILELSRLASRIWNSYYPAVIGQKQVDYMLDKMYSFDSLKKQILTDNNIFIGAYNDEEMIGFISYSKTDEREYFIHKLYVSTEIHGKGIGRQLYDFVFRDKDLKTIRLTVNRQNVKAINFYFKMGFYN